MQAKDKTRSSTLELRQTSTGILSNRPPIVGTPASSGATTPSPSVNATPGPSFAPRLSLLALTKRETARRGLYSKFFRGPILGPDDVQPEVAETEPTATATPSIPLHHDDIKKSTKQKLKINAGAEDTSGQERDERERKGEKRLRKEAERAARKRKRQDAKNRANDRKDEDTASVDERVLSPSQEQDSGPLISTAPGEVRTKKKKKKRLKPAPVEDELDGQTPVSTDKRTLEGEDHGMSRREDRSKSSRKRRKRDKLLDA